MRRLLCVLVATVGILAACGSDNKVGDESLLNFQDQAQQRLGAATTTTTPATTAAGAGGQLGVGGQAATTRPVATTAPPQQARLDIAINSDNSRTTQFSPPEARVFKGTVVTWTNKDTAPRSVEADNGAFQSPSLAPGASYTWTANVTGAFPYHDGTRPYAVATLEVVNK